MFKHPLSQMRCEADCVNVEYESVMSDVLSGTVARCEDESQRVCVCEFVCVCM